MFGNVEMTGLEMTTKIGRVMTDLRTGVTFIGLPLTRGDLSISMFMGNVSVEVTPFVEVFITALGCTIKTRHLLRSGCDLALPEHEEAKIRPDHVVVQSVMAILGLQMLECLFTVRT